MRLGEIAYARSGDKGEDANIAVFARNEEDFQKLREALAEDRVASYFSTQVTRYELPKLWGFNFVLSGILGKGGSGSLRADNQGKALAQALLLMEL